MTNASENVSVFFTNGHVTSKNSILVAAKLKASRTSIFHGAFYFRDGVWIHGDIPDSVVSVAYEAKSDEAIWLGQSGSTTSTRPGNRRSETLPDVERLGNLSRIRKIADAFYACGYGGQIYRRSANAWAHMDDGLLVTRPDATSLDMMDIDGTAHDDIYAVGSRGSIFHFDGERWTKLTSLTTAHLSGVKCVGTTSTPAASTARFCTATATAGKSWQRMVQRISSPSKLFRARFIWRARADYPSLSASGSFRSMSVTTARRRFIDFAHHDNP